MIALARQKGQAGAAVAATMGKAKLYGMLRERIEHSGKDGGAIQLRDQNLSPRDTAKALLIALSGPSNEAEANDT